MRKISWDPCSMFSCNKNEVIQTLNHYRTSWLNSKRVWDGLQRKTGPKKTINCWISSKAISGASSNFHTSTHFISKAIKNRGEKKDAARKCQRLSKLSKKINNIQLSDDNDNDNEDVLMFNCATTIAATMPELLSGDYGGNSKEAFQEFWGNF